MKKQYFALFIVTTVLFFLASCGGPGSSDPSGKERDTGAETVTEAQASEEISSETGEVPEESSTETEKPEEENTAAEAEAEVYPPSASEKMDVTNVDFDALSKISNSSEEYGFSNKNRDSLNRPDGLEYYDSLYGQYSAYNHIDTEDKTIYLTMDEGYENGYTPTILDTLKEKGVKAVFFVTEQFYDEHPELIQRMIDEGHIIGNHTCSHPASGMPSLGLKAEYEDIKKLNDEIYDTFGYQMSLFRFPQGNASKQSCALLQQMGYSSIFWSFAYYDYEPDDQMDPDDALDKCLTYIHPGAIYLLHAISKTNTEILGDFIDGAREKGYEFGVFPVDQLGTETD